MVRDNLDLDVSRFAEHFFQEHRGIPERFKGFRAGAFESVRKFGWVVHDANAVTTPTGSGFD